MKSAEGGGLGRHGGYDGTGTGLRSLEEGVCELRRRWGAAHSKRLCSDFVVPLFFAVSGARLPTV